MISETKLLDPTASLGSTFTHITLLLSSLSIIVSSRICNSGSVGFRVDFASYELTFTVSYPVQ